MDVRIGWAQFDTLGTPFDVRIGWAQFDTLAAPINVSVGWAEFDIKSKSNEYVPPYIGGGGYGGVGFIAPSNTISRYHSERNQNYIVPVELAPDANEAEEEEVIMALLMEIAARELT